MWPLDIQPLLGGVLLIDLIGGLMIVGYVIAALLALMRSESVGHARILFAEGAVLGLSFKTAGTLLKTLPGEALLDAHPGEHRADLADSLPDHRDQLRLRAIRRKVPWKMALPFAINLVANVIF